MLNFFIKIVKIKDALVVSEKVDIIRELTINIADTQRLLMVSESNCRVHEENYFAAVRKEGIVNIHDIFNTDDISTELKELQRSWIEARIESNKIREEIDIMTRRNRYYKNEIFEGKGKF